MAAQREMAKAAMILAQTARNILKTYPQNSAVDTFEQHFTST